MNNEIKEILAYFEEYVKITDMHDSEPMLNWKDLKIVLDYITNLQEENLSLAKENEQEKQFIKDCGFENVQQLALDYIVIRQEKEDYKSRIEKAVEYINKNCITSDKWEDLGFCNFIPTGKITYRQLNKSKIIELLNILNGKE